MSGIAGWFGAGVRDERGWQRAVRALSTRGRDERGLAFFGQAGGRWSPARESGSGVLIQTRVSSMNPLHNAPQPLPNEDGSITIVLDGEVYGWESERAELESLGHTFRTGSGVEMILHAYEQWGEAVLGRLRGMFAFAIVDLRRQVIFCARDQLGGKPFCWRWNHGIFSFASTVRALRELDIHQRWDISPEGIDAYLAHTYIPAPHTIYRDVFKLPAAHQMTVPLKPNTPAPGSLPYWTPEPELLDARTTLDEAITLRMSGERKIGMLISGSPASQSVAAGCARAAANGQRITAFTAGLVHSVKDPRADAARIAAERLGLTHEVQDFLMDVDDLPQIVRDLDEPFGDPSALLIWHLARAAGSSVTGGMTGAGGDEWFAALPRYAEHLKTHSASGRKSWKRLLPASPPKEWKSRNSMGGRMLRMAAEARMDWTDAYVLRFGGIEPVWRAFLQPNSGEPPPQYWRLPSGDCGTPLEWMLECDRLNVLPECILRQADLCGTAHGLELRSPLMDHRFVSSVLTLPKEQRFAGSGNGWLVDYAGMGPLQESAAGGFEPPVFQWGTHPSWKAWIMDCARQLETMTNGQIAAGRCSDMLADKECPPETVWQLVGLRLSLESLIADI